MKTILLFAALLAGNPICRTQDLPKVTSSTNTAPDYNLSIRIVPENHRLEATGTVRLPASSASRDALRVALSEQFGDPTFEVVEPATAAGPVKLEREMAPAERPGWGTVVWTIRPIKAFPQGDPIVIRFSYAGSSSRSSNLFHLGPEVCFAAGISTAWYPRIEDESGMRKRGLRATGKLEFTLPAGYVVYTTGVSQSTSTDNSRGQFRFQVSQPVYFSFAASKYSIFRDATSFPISLYLSRPRPNAKEYTDGCLSVLRALSKEFGQYQYPGFAIVEVPDKQAQEAGFEGASLDGFMLAISSFFDKKFNTAFFGHEIAHQWWPGVVQKTGPRGSYMLDEAMAQYGSLRAVEMLEGDEVAERYRRTGYPGYYSEYSALTYLSRSLAGLDERLSDLPLSDGYLSRRMADSKGMLVWDMLSRTIGRDKFSAILKDFLRKHAFQLVRWEEFLKAIEDSAGMDLKWFYQQWFDRKGAADWQLSWVQDGRLVRVSITQSQPYYRAMLVVQATGKDGERLRKTVDIRGAKTQLNWAVEFKVKSVELDPDFLYLHWTPEYRAEAEALLPYTRADLRLQQGDLDKAVNEFKSALDLVPSPDQHGLRFLLDYGLAEALIQQDKFQEAKAHVMAALTGPVRRAEVLPWVYLQLAKASKQLNDQSTLEWAVKAVISADAAAGGRTGAVEEALALMVKQ